MQQLPPQVNTALERLISAGFEAYVVGGAVRDLLRGEPVHDWDVTTSALPEQTAQVFADCRLIETGMKHGTVTVLMDGLPLEITTYRVDGPYTDRRRPDSVAFTTSLREDLARRDFTVNALAWHPQSGVVDLVGGLADLNANAIRCVGHPDTRFREDPLRILRALRFAAVYGMTIEPATAAAIRQNRALLSGIAAERILAELTRALCGPHIGPVLAEYGEILAVPIPELAPMFGFLQHNPHHDRDVWLHTAAVVAAAPAVPALRWAALLHDMGKPHCFTLDDTGVGHFYGHAGISAELAGEILPRLRMDNATRQRVITLIRHHDLPITGEDRQLRRLVNKLGEEATRQLISLHTADAMGQSSLCAHRPALFREAEAALDRLLTEEACFSLKDLAVDGRDMLELGLRGREIGAALNACLNAVLEEQVPNRKEALLQFLKK